MGEPLLRIEGLSKRFGGLAVTSDVTLTVADRELHALIGPNGAGKTTLIDQICGFLLPDAGRIVFRGRDVTYWPSHLRARQRLARSFQITAILPGFSVLDNVALAVQARHRSPLRLYGHAAEEPELNVPALAALAEVGLERRAGTPAGQLSHGEQRVLELAIALAMEPKLLLLDEPMAGTGPSETDRLIELLARLKGRFAMMLVEHDMTAVFTLADRISVLIHGQLIVSGSPESVRADPAVMAGYLGEPESPC